MNEWIELINTTCIQKLTKMAPNFKFIVNSLIMQKVGCGLHMVSAVSTYVYYCWYHLQNSKYKVV